MTTEQTILIEENITFAYWKARQWEKKQKFIDGEELDSIALFAITQAAATYDSSKSNFATYASKVIDSRIMDEIKKIRKEKAFFESKVMSDTEEYTMDNRNDVVDAQVALNLLDSLHKQILIEYHVEEYTRREIAEKHGLKQSEVESIIRDSSKLIANKCK